MLRELIKFLEQADQSRVIAKGFAEPHSFRGYYEDVAFEPAENVTVASMLEHAKSTLGQTFQGYKGGDYTMNEFTDCWICEYGTSNDAQQIGPLLLWYMLAGGAPKVEDVVRQIANSIIGPLLHVANNGKKISLNFLDEVALETEAILRPYFPPASTARKSPDSHLGAVRD